MPLIQITFCSPAKRPLHFVAFRCDIASDEPRLPEACLFPWRHVNLQVESIDTAVSTCSWTDAATASVLTGKVCQILPI